MNWLKENELKYKRIWLKLKELGIEVEDPLIYLKKDHIFTIDLRLIPKDMTIQEFLDYLGEDGTEHIYLGFH